MRRTDPLLRVLAVLAQPGPHYAYGIARAARVHSGTLHPILTRLHAAGWLTDRWDTTGTPRRYFYVTEVGRREMAEMLGQENA